MLNSLPEPRPEIVAERLDAIAHYIADNSQGTTPTTNTLSLAAKYLRKLGMNMCGEGIIGCTAGPTCKADHK